jgi:hypothetical protein
VIDDDCKERRRSLEKFVDEGSLELMTEESQSFVTPAFKDKRKIWRGRLFAVQYSTIFNSCQFANLSPLEIRQ